MTTEGPDEIWLRMITPTPVLGLEYFNVTAAPALSVVYTNQSSLPIQFTGLSYGTEFSFTVTVSNWPTCVNRADAVTSTTADICTGNVSIGQIVI